MPNWQADHVSGSEVLRLAALLWFLATGVISLVVERRSARRKERPMRRWVIVTNAVGLALVLAALVLLGLDLLGVAG